MQVKNAFSVPGDLGSAFVGPKIRTMYFMNVSRKVCLYRISINFSS
jgi:hypothetical protein